MVARRSKTATKAAAPTDGDALVAAARAADAKLQQEKRPALPRVIQLRESISSHMVEKRSSRLADLNAGFVAAAMLMREEDAPKGGWPAPNSVTRTWQHSAWGYTRSVPELGSATMFFGNCLSRCKLVVGKRNADGSVEQGFDGDEPAEGLDSSIANEAAEYVNKLKTPRGGQSEILRAFGEKVFVAGECYIVPEDIPSGLVFEVLSTQELLNENGQWRKYYGPGWGEEELPEGSVPIRVWRQDGQFQMLANSSVRACLEILEELVVLTRLVRASAISRMSLAGILAIPDELDTPDTADGAEDGGQSEAQNPLAVDIVNTGAKAIDDPASAAAWMPYIIQGPQEYLNGIKHIAFQTDDREHVIKRAEAVERLARGLDLPPEKVLGHMETTFANAGQISEDNFNLYIEPALQMLCDALTVGYLWPAMALARGLDAEHLENAPWPEDILQVAITYDARKLISRPDRSKEIIDVYVHDLTFMAVTVKEVREALGLDPEGAPDDTELAKRIDAYRLGRIREVVPAPPSDAAVPIQDATAGKAVVPGASGGSKIAGTGGKNGNGKETDAGTSSTGETPESAAAATEAILASAAIDPLRFLAAKIAGTAELTVERALERVGSRVVNKRNGLTEEEHAAVAEVDKASVPRLLGEQVVARVLGPRDDPTLAELAAFQRKVAGWARQAECSDPSRVAGEATAIVKRLIGLAMFADAPEIHDELFADVLFGVRTGA